MDVQAKNSLSVYQEKKQKFCFKFEINIYTLNILHSIKNYNVKFILLR